MMNNIEIERANKMIKDIYEKCKDTKLKYWLVDLNTNTGYVRDGKVYKCNSVSFVVNNDIYKLPNVGYDMTKEEEKELLEHVKATEKYSISITYSRYKSCWQCCFFCRMRQEEEEGGSVYSTDEKDLSEEGLLKVYNMAIKLVTYFDNLDSEFWVEQNGPCGEDIVREAYNILWEEDEDNDYFD